MDLGTTALVGAFAVTFFAGFVKGAVGFALPLIMISGLAVFVDPLLAVAGLILPTLVSNLVQALRNGVGHAGEAVREHGLYIAIVCLMIFLTAQFVTAIPENVMYVALGVPVVLLSVIQLTGLRFHIAPGARRATEVAIAVVAGVMGGVAGTWGPPTVLYLHALDTPKDRNMVVQGAVYTLASVTLLAGHMRSGVLNGETAVFSALLLVPALLGMWAGFAVHDRLDQDRFRKATMAVLVIAGLNLVRRGLAG